MLLILLCIFLTVGFVMLKLWCICWRRPAYSALLRSLWYRRFNKRHEGDTWSALALLPMSQWLQPARWSRQTLSHSFPLTSDYLPDPDCLSKLPCTFILWMSLSNRNYESGISFSPQSGWWCVRMSNVHAFRLISQDRQDGLTTLHCVTKTTLF